MGTSYGKEHPWGSSGKYLRLRWKGVAETGIGSYSNREQRPIEEQMQQHTSGHI